MTRQQARTNYLQLADEAARTVMMLTEPLDHHRGRRDTQRRARKLSDALRLLDQKLDREPHRPRLQSYLKS